MTQATGTRNSRPELFRDVLRDMTDDKLIRFEESERLWKLFVFRPVEGQATRLEHRIYTKVMPGGRLALVTFAVHSPVPGQVARSGIARVPDLTPDALDKIIDAIRRETHARPEEYTEIDLSHLATLGDQLHFLAQAGQQGEDGVPG